MGFWPGSGGSKIIFEFQRFTRKIGFEEKYYIKFDVGLVRSILNSSDPERENIES